MTRRFQSKYRRGRHAELQRATYLRPEPVAQHRRWAITSSFVGGCVFRPVGSSRFVQSVHLEEKETYRQLLTIVSGGQSCLVNGHSPSIARSQRDLWVCMLPCFISPNLSNPELECDLVWNELKRHTFAYLCGHQGIECLHLKEILDMDVLLPISLYGSPVLELINVLSQNVLLFAFSSAPASWAPAADCYTCLHSPVQWQGIFQRKPAALSAPGTRRARAPATFPAQWPPLASQGTTRRGLLMRTSAAVNPPRQLFWILALRTLSHQVKQSILFFLPSV